MLSRVTTMVYFDSLNGYVSFTYITKSCNVLEHSPCTPATATDQAPAYSVYTEYDNSEKLR